MTNITQQDIDNARQLARGIALKVQRQQLALQNSTDALSAIEAYIRGLEKTSPSK